MYFYLLEIFFSGPEKQKPIKTKYQIISLNDFMVGIGRPFVRFVRSVVVFGVIAIAMNAIPSKSIAIFDCFYSVSTGAGCRSNRLNSISNRIHLLQVVRASPHNANLDSNKTALSQTSCVLMMRAACACTFVRRIQSIDLIRVLIQRQWNSTHCGYHLRNLKPHRTILK